MPKIQRGIAGDLLRLGSCTVSDALERLGADGFARGIASLVHTSTSIAGQVSTMELESCDKGTTPKVHLGARVLDSVSPLEVIVVSNQGRTDVPAWGGILSAAAKSRRVSGVVIDGACRDVDDNVRLRFPVFARGAVSITARGRVVEKAFNEPICISGISVRKGDFVIADASGVVFISRDKIEEVIEIGKKMLRDESRMVKAILAGQSVAEVLDTRYENLVRSKSAHERSD